MEGMSVDWNGDHDVGENDDWYPLLTGSNQYLESEHDLTHNRPADDADMHPALPTLASTSSQHPDPLIPVTSSTTAFPDYNHIAAEYIHNPHACPPYLSNEEIAQIEEEANACRDVRAGYQRHETGSMYLPSGSHEDELRYRGAAFVVPQTTAQGLALTGFGDVPISPGPLEATTWSMQQVLLAATHRAVSTQDHRAQQAPVPGSLDIFDHDSLSAITSFASSHAPSVSTVHTRRSGAIASTDGQGAPSSTHVSSTATQALLPNIQHADRTWSCRVSTCATPQKTYTRISDLRKHQRCHERKTFVCSQCQRRFRWECHLRSHQLSVHDKSHMHGCSHCNKGYARRDNLIRHVRTKHPKFATSTRKKVAAKSVSPAEPRRLAVRHVPNESIDASGDAAYRQPNGSVHDWMAEPMFLDGGLVNGDLMSASLQASEGLFTPPMSRDGSSRWSQLQSLGTDSFRGQFLGALNFMSPPTTPYVHIRPGMPWNNQHFSPPSTQ